VRRYSRVPPKALGVMNGNGCVYMSVCDVCVGHSCNERMEVETL